jgi:hypothetical protein
VWQEERRTAAEARRAAELRLEAKAADDLSAAQDKLAAAQAELTALCEAKWEWCAGLHKCFELLICGPAAPCICMHAGALAPHALPVLQCLWHWGFKAAE